MSKFTITPATGDDIDELMPMLKKFHRESPYGTIAWDEDSATQYVFSVLDHGLVLIAKDEGGAGVGVIGYECSSTPFNDHIYFYLEKFYYVEEAYRSTSLGPRLEREGEAAIKARDDAHYIVMASLSTSPEHVHHYYQRRGYAPVECGYMKEIV